jgi:hypothetical protein
LGQIADGWLKSTYTAGRKVASHPLPVAIAVLVELEHGLEVVAEGEVERLGGEVADDVGGVATPQGHDTLGARGAGEALDDAIVFPVQTAGLDHLILQTLESALRVDQTPTWFWMRSLTRSIGAAAVLETAAATPPTGSSQNLL